MSIALAPTTLLDAVNECLAAIGEAPVNTLTNTGLGDAATAYNRLYNASRRVQARGWSWNTDIALQLVPDVNGIVWLPAACLKITPVGPWAFNTLVMRGNQLYDAGNHTYTFTNPVVADVVTMLDFQLLPEIARQFIFLSAVMRFQAGFIGSEILDKYTARDLQQAWAELLSDELENVDYNIYRDSPDMVSALNRVTTSDINQFQADGGGGYYNPGSSLSGSVTP